MSRSPNRSPDKEGSIHARSHVPLSNLTLQVFCLLVSPYANNNKESTLLLVLL